MTGAPSDFSNVMIGKPQDAHQTVTGPLQIAAQHGGLEIECLCIFWHKPRAPPKSVGTQGELVCYRCVGSPKCKGVCLCSIPYRTLSLQHRMAALDGVISGWVGRGSCGLQRECRGRHVVFRCIWDSPYTYFHIYIYIYTDIACIYKLLEVF